MPDIIIWLALIAAVIGAFIALCIGLFNKDQPLAYMWMLIFTVAAVAGGQWMAHARLGIQEWSVTDVYPLENVVSPDGTYIQVYTVHANIRNATRQFGKVFPDGTVVHRLERPNSSLGVLFVAAPNVRYDLVLPNEGDNSNDVED